MHKRQRVVFVFAFFFFVSISLLFFVKSSSNWFSGAVFSIFSPIEKVFFHSSQKIKPISSLDKAKQEIAKLQSENAALQSLAQDNKALRDQFQTTTSAPTSLIPVEIVGMPQFIPGMSAPESFIIQSNTKAFVGMPVIYENMLLGEISEIDNNFAKVQLVTSQNMSFTAKTANTNAIGISKGQGGGQIIFDNVVLSDSLQVGDTIVTSGETSLHGKGIMPGLVVGKITSVEKNPSSLFQKASIAQLIDITKLTTVFLMTQ